MEIKIKVKKGYEPEDVLVKALRGVRAEREQGTIRDPNLKYLHDYSSALYDVVTSAMIEDILDIMHNDGRNVRKSERPERLLVRK